MHSTTRRKSAVAATMGSIMIAATACGGGSSGASDSGDVVKVGVIQEETGAFASDYLTEWGVGAQAAVDYINEEMGGFGDREVELITCDSQSSAAGALTCANRFLSEEVDFVTGLSIFWGANGMAVMEKAGIPSQTGPISVQDASSPISYPYGGGIFTELPAATNFAIDQLGASNISAVVADGPGNEVFFEQYGKPVEAAGGELTEVLAPPSGDLSPSIARALSSDPDVIVTPLSNTQLVPYYAGLKEQGFDMSKVISVGAAVDADNFFDLVEDKETIEGTLYTYEFASFDDIENPEVKLYRDAMDTYAGVPGRGEFFQWAFSTVMTNYQIAEKMGFDKFDASTLMETLDTETVPLFMGHEYSKEEHGTEQTPGIGNPWIRFVQYKDGKVEDVSDGWLNGYTGEVVSD